MIRELKESEIPLIADIERVCFSTPWSEKSIEDSFCLDCNHFFVCESEGRIAGYIGLSIAADEGYILNVAVLPEYRRKGIGEALVRYVITGFGDLAFVTLEVRPSNTAAVALYQKLGFERVGERKNYYRNPDENALLLTKFFKE
ncbi:MAG: ribosomal protein S18-alanine N-acetyltransferase [Ruminococcus sp.]|nr:ribosomal protein S18-alanine N-acetyltransferase [Ruminococcus sp.]